MKAALDNTSAMAMCRRGRKTGTDHLLWVALGFVCLGLMASGCSPRATADADGRMPRDVAMEFLRLVEDGEFEHASRLWVHAPVQVGPRTPFRSFAGQFVGLQNVRVGDPVKQKADFWSVAIEGTRNQGQTFGRYLYLQKQDGVWKLYPSGGGIAWEN